MMAQSLLEMLISRKEMTSFAGTNAAGNVADVLQKKTRFWWLNSLLAMPKCLTLKKPVAFCSQTMVYN